MNSFCTPHILCGKTQPHIFRALVKYFLKAVVPKSHKFKHMHKDSTEERFSKKYKS